PGSARGTRGHRRLPGKGLQPEATALGSGLSAAGRVRAKPGAKHKGGRFAAASSMSFLRHQEIFPSDGGANLTANTPAHRLDEFPAGYSLAGCSPAWPASTSPTGTEYAVQSVCWSRTFHRTARCVLTICVSRGDKVGCGRSSSVSTTRRNPGRILREAAAACRYTGCARAPANP